MAALTRFDPSATPAGDGRPESIRFCSRCGHLSDEPRGHLHLHQRVCDRCEMGVLLSCRPDALPGPGAAFLVCTFELDVAAVSEAAEAVFGPEPSVIGVPLLDLATCPLGDEQLSRHAALAAQRPGEPVVVPLRVRTGAGEALGMLAARIATCGPPRAALVAVEPTGFGRR